MPTYIALVERGKDTYGVTFPDFPGCVTGGNTIDDAVKRAQEILPFHIDGMQEDDIPIPEPSSLDQILHADPDAAECLPVLVPVPEHAGKAIRVNITMDEVLLAAIDAYATGRGQSRSAFLAEAAKRLISKSWKS